MDCSSLAERRVAFEVAGRRFNWCDLVAAARAWGDWALVEQAASSALLALEAARASGVPLAGPEFDAEAHHFRHVRHLLSADELERWLADRGLDTEQWLDYVRGVIVSESLPPARLAQASGSAPPAAAWAQAICSGALTRVAERLASRAAVTVAGGGSLPRGRLSAFDVRELDRAFERFRAAQADPAAVIRALDRHREDWTQVDLHRLLTDDRNVAREVALCVRVDGRQLAEVSEDAGLALERRRTTLEQVDEPVRTSLLGARRRELIGPYAIDGGYWLVELLDRRAPSLDQPDVADRARRAAIERAIRREVADRVSWHECP
jgi:hypothetical protein